MNLNWSSWFDLMFPDIYQHTEFVYIHHKLNAFCQILGFKMRPKEVPKCHLEGKWRIERKILARYFVFFFSPVKASTWYYAIMGIIIIPCLAWWWRGVQGITRSKAHSRHSAKWTDCNILSCVPFFSCWASLVTQMVETLSANAGDPGLISGLGRSPR